MDWTGSWYELAIELGLYPDERLNAAATALWSHPSLDGPYADDSRETDAQPRVAPAAADNERLCGILTLPDGNQMPCWSRASREDMDSGGGSDWLCLLIPTAALDEVYDLWGHPTPSGWEDVSWQPWAEPLDELLADIGRTVYEETPFRLGIIGEEADGELYASDVAANGIEDDLYWSLLYPDERGSLRFYPATW
jgi:hypothetical protein